MKKEFVVKKIQISELHKLRLVVFILKHIAKVERDTIHPDVMRKIRKTHHRLIKKNINKSNVVDEKLPEGSNVNANDSDFYTVTGLLRKYGYFRNGLPALSVTLNDGSVLEKPGHRILKGWIRSLSLILSVQYKKIYNELPPIGYGHTGKNTTIGSRNNLYKLDDEGYKEIIDKFMLEHPENIWFEISMGKKLDFVPIKIAKSKNTEKHKERVSEYLEVKEYLPRRIKKKITDKEKQTEALNELEDLFKKCRSELPKSKEMNIMFRGFREKYAI
jgi:hypothetical protein